MSGNLGNISINLSLNIEPFKNQLQTVLNFLKNLQTARIGDLGADPSGLKQLTSAMEKTVTETDKAEKETKQLNTEVEKTGAVSKKSVGEALQNLKNFFVLTTTAYLNLKQIIGPIVDFGRESVTAFEKSEIALAKLRNGLKNVGEGADAFARLTNQADQLQKITPFADEDITNAQSMLTTFMKSSQEIEILTPRILDLAAAYQTTGDSSMSLQQIAVMVGKVNEETVGQLRRVGVAFTQEQEAKLKSLKGTEQAIYLSQILDQNFKGMAETIGNTFAGKMKILSNQWDDVKEKIGGLLAQALIPLAKIFTDIIPVLDNFVQELVALGKEFGNSIQQVLGGKQSFDDLKAGIVELVQSALASLMKHLRDLQPYYIALVKSIKDLIGENVSLKDILLKVIDVIFAVMEALTKWSLTVYKTIADILGWFRALYDGVSSAVSSIIGWFSNALPTTWVSSLVSIITTVKNKLMDFVRWAANQPVLKILFPGLQFVETGTTIQEQGYVPKPGDYDVPLPPKKETSYTTTSTGTGTSQQEVGQEEKKLSMLEEENKKIEELNAKLELNKGNRGAELEIMKEIEKVQERILYLQTGERPMTKILDELGVGKTTEKIKEELLKRQQEIEENQKKIDDDLLQKKIANIEDEYKRRRAEIDYTYDQEMKRIEQLQDATDVQKRDLRNLARSKKERELKVVDEQESLQPFFQMKSIAEQIQNIFGIGADTVFGGFVKALQITEQIIALLKSLEIASSIFSLITGIFTGGASMAIPLASGGSVPGSGSGDTVPAWLTPGEYVIRKARVQQIGTQFLNWLNGGGTLNQLTQGRYASGGMVMAGRGKQVVEVVLKDFKLKGADIHLSQQRYNIIESKLKS